MVKPTTKVTCPSYAPLVDSKKCRHFYDEFQDLAGACELDTELMCPVWEADRVVIVDGDLVQVRKKLKS